MSDKPQTFQKNPCTGKQPSGKGEMYSLMRIQGNFLLTGAMLEEEVGGEYTAFSSTLLDCFLRSKYLPGALTILWG